ncbi:MAG: hypothetical protein MI975_23735 [Cytophagales bacterium]|nr:hypothetical protein [Cytophagales bacterium]
MIKPISVQQHLLDIIPEIRLGSISYEVTVVPSDASIVSFSETVIQQIQSDLILENVRERAAIKATKNAYRILGKDPSRYRPSAEALARRIVHGKGLYLINNIVDILNLISLESGFSIGGYDADKIEGGIEFGVGKENEPYDAIGRGALNIENLPVFRDELGAFGSPTSDSLRTMVTYKTSRFLMIIIDFCRHENLEQTVERSIELYEKYTNAKNIQVEMIR